MTSKATNRRPAFFREDLRVRVERFAGGPLTQGVVGSRSQSYDHCYNYFSAAARPSADLEKSCAVLSFYLASWGMYRGSTYLFKNTSSQHFIPLISYLEQHAPMLCSIDVDGYDAQHIEVLLEAYARIRDLVLPTQHAALTLVIKILAGVAGCAPAFDTYFVRGARSVFSGSDARDFSTFSARSLWLLNALYVDNKEEVDALAQKSATVGFPGGAPGGPPLSRAKVLDMFGFELGYRPSLPAKRPSPDTS